MKPTLLMSSLLRLTAFAAVALICVGGTAIPAARADLTATLDVDLGKPGPAIPPDFGGLMTEEINHSYDGGLFAELIQNRTFQDPVGKNISGNTPVHWSVIGPGRVAPDRADPVNPALPVSLRLELPGGTSGAANDGYWGIPVRPDTTYTASFYAKGGGGFDGPVTASLLLDDGYVTVAEALSPSVGRGWQKYTVTLRTKPDAPTTAKARFVLSATGTGSVWFSLVSLFPPTYRNTPGGLRPDLMNLLADLRPGFIRLPGGNYLEGDRFSDRFSWKRQIGPADQRPGHMGCWSYRSSDGFGLPQYLLWCQQLNAEPVLAVFAGYVLNGDHVWAGGPEMAAYAQEALEEIEYVSGPADSEWGKRRVADGFPEPFRLRYVEIGNEDWFDKSGSYDARFTQIARAIRERYPDLKLIATAPVKSFRPDLYDDHLYASSQQMLAAATQYDPHPPGAASSPLKFDGGRWSGRQADDVRTFVGEWAAQEGRPTPNLNAALADAAWLMGLERNADAVPIECYAPLFANVNPADSAKGYPKGWQWPTNLIGYDALRSFGSPSYYAQVMLAQNRGGVNLPVAFKVSPAVAGADPTPHGAVGVGTFHTQVEYTDISVTAPDGKTLLKADLTKDTTGWQFTGDKWNLADNAIKPSAANSESWAITGSTAWTDYTVRVRARKLGGREGFLLLWHATDGDNYKWWNLGGWDNTATRFETAEAGNRTALGSSANLRIEPNRWYDLRLEVTGNRVRGFVDDKLVSEAALGPHENTPAVFATAAYAREGHRVFVKVVNAGNDPIDAAVRLRGAGRVEPRGTALVLAGDPKAVNTIDQPTNVAPKESAVNASASFRRVFPPHSFTLLRLTAPSQP